MGGAFTASPSPGLMKDCHQTEASLKSIQGTVEEYSPKTLFLCEQIDDIDDIDDDDDDDADMDNVLISSMVKTVTCDTLLSPDQFEILVENEQVPLSLYRRHRPSLEHGNSTIANTPFIGSGDDGIRRITSSRKRLSLDSRNASCIPKSDRNKGQNLITVELSPPIQTFNILDTSWGCLNKPSKSPQESVNAATTYIVGKQLENNRYIKKRTDNDQRDNLVDISSGGEQRSSAYIDRSLRDTRFSPLSKRKARSALHLPTNYETLNTYDQNVQPDSTSQQSRYNMNYCITFWRLSVKIICEINLFRKLDSTGHVTVNLTYCYIN